MISLFGEPKAGGKRDALEGRLFTVALQALHRGTNAVLDFGETIPEPPSGWPGRPEWATHRWSPQS